MNQILTAGDDTRKGQRGVQGRRRRTTSRRNVSETLNLRFLVSIDCFSKPAERLFLRRLPERSSAAAAAPRVSRPLQYCKREPDVEKTPATTALNRLVKFGELKKKVFCCFVFFFPSRKDGRLNYKCVKSSFSRSRTSATVRTLQMFFYIYNVAHEI